MQRAERRQRIVMVTGAVPGLGKSTLCRGLIEHFVAAGSSVVRFGEMDILERDEFAEVMAVWRTGAPVPMELLLASTTRYVTSCVGDEADVFVQDMLFPFLPSLLAFGYDDEEIQRFISAFADRCAAVDLLQIHLTGDARRALQRAGRREGPGWLEQLMTRVSKFLDHSETITDLDGLSRYYHAASQRSEQLLAATPWPLIRLDAESGAEAVAEQAFELLDGR